MSKYMVGLKINLDKIDEKRIFKGKKGRYADLTLRLDTENPSGKYGDNGLILQNMTAAERAAQVQMPILGHATVLFKYDDVPEFKLPINYDEADRGLRRAAKERYIQIQDNKCSFCGCLLNDQPRQDILNTELDESLFPENFLKFPVHLHHDHNTKMTLGAVHARCNAILWQHHGK